MLRSVVPTSDFSSSTSRIVVKHEEEEEESALIAVANSSSLFLLEEALPVQGYDDRPFFSSSAVGHTHPTPKMTDIYDDDTDSVGGEGGGKERSKSRRELPAGAVATLKAWLLSPEHFTHPYPTPQDQAMLMQKTGIDKKQLKNWFTNARRRIWKPMLKK
jgi:hypothetical protein